MHRVSTPQRSDQATLYRGRATAQRVGLVQISVLRITIQSLKLMKHMSRVTHLCSVSLAEDPVWWHSQEVVFFVCYNPTWWSDWWTPRLLPSSMGSDSRGNQRLVCRFWLEQPRWLLFLFWSHFLQLQVYIFFDTLITVSYAGRSTIAACPSQVWAQGPFHVLTSVICLSVLRMSCIIQILYRGICSGVLSAAFLRSVGANVSWPCLHS